MARAAAAHGPGSVRHPDIVATGRHHGCKVETRQPFDPESKGGARRRVKIAKADLAPAYAAFVTDDHPKSPWSWLPPHDVGPVLRPFPLPHHVRATAAPPTLQEPAKPSTREAYGVGYVVVPMRCPCGPRHSPR
ncbi:hypothetical protein GCM10010399_14950 [Dactylosporangium fulvum]